jgi:hypothetical protein
MVTKSNISLVIQVALVAICMYLVFKPSKEVFPTSSKTIIEKRIAGKETVIREKGKLIDNSNKIISELNAGLFDLHSQLDSVKNARDTFNIIQ